MTREFNYRGVVTTAAPLSQEDRDWWDWVIATHPQNEAEHTLFRLAHAYAEALVLDDTAKLWQARTAMLLHWRRHRAKGDGST